MAAYTAVKTSIIEVNTGADGTWITLKTSKGKKLTFQPAIELERLNSGLRRQAFSEWLEERQKEYRKANGMT